MGIFDEKTIYRAAEQGDVAEVERLLIEDAECLNRPGNDGWTALHWAAAGGHADVARLLLSRGADVYACDRRGYAPWYWARVYHGNTEITGVLAGAEEVASTQMRTIRETAARQQREIEAVYQAAGLGKVEILRQLLQQQPELVNSVANDSVYPTPLLVAIFNKRVEVVRVLLEMGARTEQTKQGYKTALSLAATTGHSEIVECLIGYGANLAARCFFEETPLHNAALSYSPSTVQALIDAGAWVNAQDSLSRAPLHLAASNIGWDNGKWYGVHSGVSPIGGDKSDEDERIKRQAQIIDILLTAGADISIRDFHGRSPLEVAIKDFAPRGLTTYEEAMSRPQVRLLTRASRRIIPVFRAVLDGDADRLKALLQQDKSAAMCIDHWHMTPLHVAAETDLVAIAQLLLGAGADVHVQDIDQKTPEERAIAQGHIVMAELLRVAA